MTKRQRRTYTDDFKAQMVKLYQSGKPKKEIMDEYELLQQPLILGLKEAKLPALLKKKTIELKKKMN